MSEIITALSDEALGLIEPDTDTIDNDDDVELDNDEGIEYEESVDDEYLDDDDYEDEDIDEEDDDEYDDDEESDYDDDDEYVEALDIDGIGEVSIDDIKEWYNGNLRQSDYTKKTQELAHQREELKEAELVYKYLRDNPHLLQSVADGRPIADPNLSNIMSEDKKMLKELFYNQKSMQIDMKLNELKDKYGEVDEVALFNKAAELKTDDLEFVYKSLVFDNYSDSDLEDLKEQIRQEVLDEINKNKKQVKTIVSTRQGNNHSRGRSVSEDEKRVAEGLGLSVKDYMKWRG